MTEYIFWIHFEFIDNALNETQLFLQLKVPTILKHLNVNLLRERDNFIRVFHSNFCLFYEILYFLWILWIAVLVGCTSTYHRVFMLNTYKVCGIPYVKLLGVFGLIRTILYDELKQLLCTKALKTSSVFITKSPRHLENPG